MSRTGKHHSDWTRRWLGIREEQQGKYQEEHEEGFNVGPTEGRMNKVSQTAAGATALKQIAEVPFSMWLGSISDKTCLFLIVGQHYSLLSTISQQHSQPANSSQQLAVL